MKDAAPSHNSSCEALNIAFIATLLSIGSPVVVDDRLVSSVDVRLDRLEITRNGDGTHTIRAVRHGALN